MRILELNLLRYGHFADVSLTFGAPGLHVVHGENEAGKSTTLRALSSLLYGIPERTPDAFLFRPDELRVGGLLADERGATFRVVRRKGRSNTLLGADGKPVDDTRLRALLGGVERAHFENTFGLTHGALRAGGEELRVGRGDLGESLFSAGLGGANVHALLAQLEQRAAALFTRTGQKRELNQTIAAYREARLAAQAVTLGVHEWQAADTALREAREQRAESALRVRALEVRSAVLERVQRVREPLARHDRSCAALALERASLARDGLPELGAAAARAREEAERDQREASAREARLDELVEARLLARSAIAPPGPWLAESAAIESLARHAATHDDALRGEPRLRAERVRLQAESAALRHREGLSEGALRAPASAHALLRKLAAERAKLDESAAHLAREHASALAAVATLKSRVLPAPVGDGSRLRRVLDEGRVEGNLEALAREAARERDAARVDLERRVASLGLGGGGEPRPATELAALAVPALPALEAHEAALAEVDADLEQARRRVDEQDHELAEVALRERELRLEGDVPEEADLKFARATRDHLWRLFALDGRGAPKAADYLAAVARADDLADRLRREAHRVGRLAQLTASREQRLADRTIVAETLDDLERRRRQLAAAWGELWRPAAVVPRSPAEMRTWLVRHGDLVRAFDRVVVATASADACMARAYSRRTELSDALVAVGAVGVASGELLSSAVHRAAAHLDSLVRHEEERRRIDEALADRERELARVSFEQEGLQSRKRAWELAWTPALATLGLPLTASPEEADAALASALELARNDQEVQAIEHALEALTRDAATLAAQVAAFEARLATSNAVDAGLDASARAFAFAERLRRAREDEVRLRQLDSELDERRADLADVRERRRSAEARIERLLAAGNVSTLPALAMLEERSARVRAQEEEVLRAADVLATAGDGRSVEELRAEVQAVEGDALLPELNAVRETIARLRAGAEDQDRALGGLEATLRAMDGRDAAAEAAAQAQQVLARMRDQVEEYTRLRLSEALLRREIERWREAHQAPLLLRASAHFQALTMGSFLALRAGYDEHDRAVLECVRPSGAAVDVEALSEGTRDQLYLALRLASVEQHVARNAPLPLVVDDILIHFDERRARAALLALAQVSDVTQVILFTHHAHVVQLAMSALGPLATVHDLTPMTQRGGGADLGDLEPLSLA